MKKETRSLIYCCQCHNYLDDETFFDKQGNEIAFCDECKNDIPVKKPNIKKNEKKEA